MQLPREPRFRPVQMLDEWPFARTQQHHHYQGPAQKDNVKELLYDEEKNIRPSNNNNSHGTTTTALGRRDPNQQSDPIQADQEHPWNRCRIKKIEPPQHKDHGHGKKINSFFGGGGEEDLSATSSSRNNNTRVAPWENPNSMSALQKKYSNYEYPLQNTNQNQNTNNIYGREGSVESNLTSSSSTTSCASTARRRAQQQAQGSNWFALTKSSPFENSNTNQHEQQQEEYFDQQQQQQEQEFCNPVGPRVGEPTHLRNYYSASEQRLTSSGKLIQQMLILARSTGRCNSALWQSCLEGHILRKPYCHAPTTRDVLRNYNKVNDFDKTGQYQVPQNQQQQQDVNGRLRRTVPFVELIVQIEDALGQQVSDKALADVLGLGENCHDNTPVRYEHFLRLFNA